MKKVILAMIIMITVSSLCYGDIQEEAREQAGKIRQTIAIKYLVQKYEKIANLEAEIKQLEKEIQEFDEKEFVAPLEDIIIIGE